MYIKKASIIFYFYAIFSIGCLAVHDPPKVVLTYAAPFDNICSIKTAYKIEKSWIRELIQRLPYWQSLWQNEGHLLLKTTIDLIGKPFVHEEFHVALSLCNFPSMSMPLIVNARYLLGKYMKEPRPDFILMSIIFHEVLHNYLTPILPKETALLKKYKQESFVVLNHLHLLALIKSVYLSLGWQEKLDAIIRDDEKLAHDGYKRAWEIINKYENYIDFINEIKTPQR